MKAGIVEVPHIAVVTKADMGGPAERAARELEGALSLAEPEGDWEVAVRLVAAPDGVGIDALMADLDRHRQHLGDPTGLRCAQAGLWLKRQLHDLFGRRGLAVLERERPLPTAPDRPFAAYAELSGVLEARLRSTQDGTLGTTVAAPA
jgi:LAO/AO transport system kinase